MTNKTKKPLFQKNFYEEQAWSSHQTVCGIDEVGRGCLAGPLVTAAVILPQHTTQPLLQDSKLLSAAKRELAYEWISKNCIYGIGILHNRLIDEHNIWQTTLLAMKKALVHALSQTTQNPSIILVDAMPLTLGDTGYGTIEVASFIKGESKSSSIAAASIIAKVTRDRLMKTVDTLFPGYGIVDHKGYATLKHRTALVAQGPSIIHRTTFLPEITIEVSHEQQQTIF